MIQQPNAPETGTDSRADYPRLEDTQRAVLNILEDFDAEKHQLENTQKAIINILEDINPEKEQLEQTQRAVLNILEDADAERINLEMMQRATFNILDDVNADKAQMQDTPRALLNILDDLNVSNEELQRSRDVLEVRVTERTAELQESNVQLQAKTAELGRSNSELEQFAYIASHDLQEPLRMVSSYVQLLGKRYQGKLDADADEFIRFAADGANRMQRLINDLLAFSRVGTRGSSFEHVSLEIVLAQVLDTLKLLVQDTGVNITHDPLPVVYGDAGQIAQVFQNLIDNAVKFRREEAPPCVHISAEIRGGESLISVRDNGIGIDPQYAERIFLIFQRLHTRAKYPGTGIGLAICKRIIERHGGRIWVEVNPGQGSTFYFTLPLSAQKGLSHG